MLFVSLCFWNSGALAFRPREDFLACAFCHPHIMDSTGSPLVQHLPIPLPTYFFKDLFYFRHIQNLLVHTGRPSERGISLPF